MSEKFYIYTQPNCPHCTLVMNYLENRGVEFEERDISKNDNWAADVRDLGYMGVPVTVKEFTEEETHGVQRTSTLGFNIPAIDKMLDYIV